MLVRFAVFVKICCKRRTSKKESDREFREEFKCIGKNSHVCLIEIDKREVRSGKVNDTEIMFNIFFSPIIVAKY